MATTNVVIGEESKAMKPLEISRISPCYTVASLQETQAALNSISPTNNDSQLKRKSSFISSSPNVDKNSDTSSESSASKRAKHIHSIREDKKSEAELLRRAEEEYARLKAEYAELTKGAEHSTSSTDEESGSGRGRKAGPHQVTTPLSANRWSYSVYDLESVAMDADGTVFVSAIPVPKSSSDAGVQQEYILKAPPMRPRRIFCQDRFQRHWDASRLSPTHRPQRRPRPQALRAEAASVAQKIIEIIDLTGSDDEDTGDSAKAGKFASSIRQKAASSSIKYPIAASALLHFPPPLTNALPSGLTIATAIEHCAGQNNPTSQIPLPTTMSLGKFKWSINNALHKTLLHQCDNEPQTPDKYRLDRWELELLSASQYELFGEVFLGAFRKVRAYWGSGKMGECEAVLRMFGEGCRGLMEYLEERERRARFVRELS